MFQSGLIEPPEQRGVGQGPRGVVDGDDAPRFAQSGDGLADRFTAAAAPFAPDQLKIPGEGKGRLLELPEPPRRDRDDAFARHRGQKPAQGMDEDRRPVQVGQQLVSSAETAGTAGGGQNEMQR